MGRKVRYLTASTNRVYTSPLLNPETAGVYQRTKGITASPSATPGASPITSVGSEFDDVFSNIGTPTTQYRTTGTIGIDSLGGKWGGKYADYSFAESMPDTENGGNAYDVRDDNSSSARFAAGGSRKIVDVAKSYLGQNRYQYGVFDCSKFTQEVAGKAGEKIPRTASQQYDYFKNKRRLFNINQARAGDLVFLASPYSPSGWHVGVYVGNGKMIDNAGRGKPIAVRNLWGKIRGFGRMNVKYTPPKASSNGKIAGTQLIK